MLRSTCLVALLTVASLIGAHGRAVAADDSKICVDESGDVAIDACTRVINSGNAPRGQVIEAYRNRGVEWYLKKNYDRAIDDATSAIAIASDHSPSYYLRFKSYQQKGEEARGMADLEKAISTDFNVEAYVARAQYKERKGDTAGALADYRRALEQRHQKYDYIGQDSVRDIARDALKRLQ